MLKKHLYWLVFGLFCFFSISAGGEELYLCKHTDGQDFFFQKDQCQLRSDPTTPFSDKPIPIKPIPIKPIPIKPPPSAPPEKKLKKPSKISLLPPVVGSWEVTQILVSTETASQKKRIKKQAVINNLLVGVGDWVAGGQVREIVRDGVFITHVGGEAWIPFDWKTVVRLPNKEGVHFKLEEVDGVVLSWMDRVMRGETIILTKEGVPVIRLLPFFASEGSESPLEESSR